MQNRLCFVARYNDGDASVRAAQSSRSSGTANKPETLQFSNLSASMLKKMLCRKEILTQSAGSTLAAGGTR
jgi:hypothetical protein